MSNIEEDVKRQTKNTINYYKNLEKIEEIPIDILRAMYKDVLAQRKQDKARIKELEEALLKVKDKNTTLFITCRNSIPKQKVKDKIERHEFAKKDFEKEYDNKHYEDDEIRARDFYMIVAEDLIIKNLKDLLEDK